MTHDQQLYVHFVFWYIVLQWISFRSLCINDRKSLISSQKYSWDQHKNNQEKSRVKLTNKSSIIWLHFGFILRQDYSLQLPILFTTSADYRDTESRDLTSKNYDDTYILCMNRFWLWTGSGTTVSKSDL